MHTDNFEILSTPLLATSTLNTEGQGLRGWDSARCNSIVRALGNQLRSLECTPNALKPHLDLEPVLGLGFRG